MARQPTTKANLLTNTRFDNTIRCSKIGGWGAHRQSLLSKRNVEKREGTPYQFIGVKSSEIDTVSLHKTKRKKHKNP